MDAHIVEKERLSVGAVCLCRSFEEVEGLVGEAERAHLDFLAFADVPQLGHDPFLAALTAARFHPTLRLGVGVVNGSTRNPAIVANLAAGIADAGSTEVILGLGTGNSGVRQVGGSRSTVSELESTVNAVRTMGQSLAARRTLGAKEQRKTAVVKVVVAGSGPRVLQMGSRVADEVWVNIGCRDADASTGLAWTSSLKSGRRWLFAIGSFAEDRDRARRNARSGAAALGRYVLDGEQRRGDLDPVWEQPVRSLIDRYDYSAHLAPGDSANAALAETLGMADYLVDRFAVAGTTEDCTRHLHRLQATGFPNICLSFSASQDPVGDIRRLGEAAQLHTV